MPLLFSPSPALSGFELDVVSVSSASTVTSIMTDPPRYADKMLSGLIVFKIDQYYYRISSKVLVESSYFRSVLQQAFADGSGISEAFPIVLDHVSAHGIDSLLDVMMDMVIKTDEKFEIGRLGSALHLATQWDFNGARDHIIAQLDDIYFNCDYFDFIDIAIICRNEAWLQQGYISLCERAQSLSDQEGERLGLPRSLAICRIREESLVTAALGSLEKEKLTSWIRQEPSLQLPPVGTEVADDGKVPDENVSRHPRHYDTDSIVIRIAGILVAVPRQIGLASSYLQDRLSSGGEGLGRWDGAPVDLQGDFTVTDADAFTFVLKHCAAAGSMTAPSDSFDVLASGLFVASHLRLTPVQDFVKAKINATFHHQDPLNIIEAARRCGCREWLVPQYVRLCDREEPITDVEGGRLGCKRLAAVCRVREKRVFKAAKKLKVRMKMRETTVDWIRKEPHLVDV